MGDGRKDTFALIRQLIDLQGQASMSFSMSSITFQ